MPSKDRKSQTEVSTLFADASNSMHGSFDIPRILQAAVLTAVTLVGAKAGAAALLMNGRLVLSEYCEGQNWRPLQCNFGDEVSWVRDLIGKRTLLIMSKPDDIQSFAELTGHSLPATDELAVVPVIGKQYGLLACLLLFAKTRNRFDRAGTVRLEQLASMMSVAIENAIQQSESRRIEADLEKSVATYRMLVEQIPAITYIATLDRSRILFISPQVEDILGYSQNDFLADQEIWSQQIHQEDRGRVLSEMRQSLKANIPFHSEYRICAKDGRDIWVKDAAATVRDQDQDIYLQGIVHDISERKASEQKLTMMAHFDQLTGLANRTLFHDRLSHIVAQSKRHRTKFALIYIDLDGFKAVNDHLGHQAGDELLVETANRLRSQVREVDTVARMGGDEFTIILDDVHSKDSIELIANKLIETIAAPYEYINPEYSVTMSMGIAFYPDDSTSADVLITAADNAMYRAKNSGKNCYCFHQMENTD